jgi:hypothetical protein
MGVKDTRRIGFFPCRAHIGVLLKCGTWVATKHLSNDMKICVRQHLYTFAAQVLACYHACVRGAVCPRNQEP